MPRFSNEPPAHLDELAHRVIGIAIDVHRALGPGYIESVYHRALEVELETRSIPFQSQLRVPVPYRGVVIGEFHLDFLIAEELVIESKAVERLLPIHQAQLISYLKAGGFQLGLLLNFNSYVLRDGIKRVIWNHDPV